MQTTVMVQVILITDILIIRCLQITQLFKTLLYEITLLTSILLANTRNLVIQQKPRSSEVRVKMFSLIVALISERQRGTFFDTIKYVGN